MPVTDSVKRGMCHWAACQNMVPGAPEAAVPVKRLYCDAHEKLDAHLRAVPVHAPRRG